MVLINTFKNIVFPSSVTNEYSILSSCQKVEEVCDSKYVLHFCSNLKLNQFNPDDLQYTVYSKIINVNIVPWKEGYTK